MDYAQVVEAAHRTLHHANGPTAFCSACDAPQWGGRPALLILAEGRNGLHVVEARAVAGEVERLVGRLRRFPANRRWLALPQDAYLMRRGHVLAACRARGVGLLLATSARRVAEVKLAPRPEAGDFVAHYPAVVEAVDVRRGAAQKPFLDP